MSPHELATIDLSPWLDGDPRQREAVAGALDAAAAKGFFYLAGHGIAPSLFETLEAEARRFFALPANEKARIAMAHGGRAWRGWFPLHGELTSGRPDGKEGLYLGEELGPGDPRVAAGWPLHGANLWPDAVPSLRAAVADWLQAATRAGHALVAAMNAALGLPDGHLHRAYTARPTLLFRIFRYPPAEPDFGVGAHSDYGFLTLLAQDRHGGLQIETGTGWHDVPPRPGQLVVNIGDMLERLTGGRWRSVPHRVINSSDAERLSWPLFFDPAFDAVIRPLPGSAAAPAGPRWDGIDIHGSLGTYGDYLLAKVGKVFPELLADTGLDRQAV